MKALRNLVDKIKPNFEKGKKLGFLHSTFDAFETFLFVPDTVTLKGAHIRDAIDLKRTMSVVVMALIPALMFGMWNAGYQHYLSIGQTESFWIMFGYGALKVLPIVIVAYVVGLGIEFVAAQIRGHEVNEGFLVTGMLIPLVMPVDVPLWMVALATAFSVIIGKEVFGGTGMNIFNPALLARAFVFFAYPSYISGDKIWIAGLSSGQGVVDGFSGATPLAKAYAGAHFSNMDWWNMFTGMIPGSIGETSTIAILIGAVILIATGVASWKTMVSVVAGGLTVAVLLHVIGANAGTLFPDMQPGVKGYEEFAHRMAYFSLPLYAHLIMGGFAFGTVFMATDPVTSAQTERGKWIYGFLIGVLAVTIRVFNPGFPEGMMLAILFMNAFAPLIDHYVVQANIKRRLNRAKTTK